MNLKISKFFSLNLLPLFFVAKFQLSEIEISLSTVSAINLPKIFDFWSSKMFMFLSRNYVKLILRISEFYSMKFSTFGARKLSSSFYKILWINLKLLWHKFAAFSSFIFIFLSIMTLTSITHTPLTAVPLYLTGIDTICEGAPPGEEGEELLPARRGGGGRGGGRRRGGRRRSVWRRQLLRRASLWSQLLLDA